MSSERDTLLELANREYKAGFVTDIESETIPAGLNEEIVRTISAKKKEPEWMLDFRLKAYRHWITMKEPTWPNVHYPAIDYQSIVYYSAPKAKSDGPKSLEEVDPKLLETYEKLGIPLRERAKLAGVAVDAVFDCVSVATTFREQLAKVGVIFCSFSEAVQNHPDLVKKYLGSVVPYSDNFFATLNSAVFSDGSFCYIPKGVRCPMELSTYFRINCRQDGTVRAHAHHRGRGVVRQLPRGLHRPDARREPAPRGRRRAGRAGERRDQVLDGPELVSRRQERQGGHLQLRDQARQVPGEEVQDLLDAGRDGLCHHLEVSELHPAGRQLGRRVLFRRRDEQLPAGGHRHQDDPHRKEHASPRSSPRGSRRATARTPTAAWSRSSARRDNARNYSQCDSLLIGDKCGAHTFPYIEVNNSTAQMEHEASTSKIGEDQIFYCQQRGISPEEAVSMIVNGFCKDVFKELPMEFAVEAQKLLGVSLEGSVG